MKMKATMAAALAMAVVCGLVPQTVSAATDIILSNDTNDRGLKGQTFEVFRKEIEKRLGDDANVELYHSGTLFNQKTQIQGLQLGSAHVIAPTAGIYSAVAPNVNVLLLPFLLSTPEAIDAALKDETIRKAFVPDLEAKNIVPIAVWMNGPRSVGHSGSEPALTPDGWGDKKIRVQSAPVFVKTMEAVGANVVPMSWSELPTALQTGVIDAAEPTPNAWKGAGLYEMVDHIILNEYVYSFYVVGANKLWWDGLSDDVRTKVEEALAAATKWNWDNEAKMNSDAIAFIRDAGVEVHALSDEQRQAWRDAVAPVWEELGRSVVGDEVMSRLEEIADQYPPN